MSTVLKDGGIGGGVADEAAAITFIDRSRVREKIREDRRRYVRNREKTTNRILCRAVRSF